MLWAILYTNLKRNKCSYSTISLKNWSVLHRYLQLILEPFVSHFCVCLCILYHTERLTVTKIINVAAARLHSRTQFASNEIFWVSLLPWPAYTKNVIIKRPTRGIKKHLSARANYSALLRWLNAELYCKAKSFHKNLRCKRWNLVV